MSEVRLIDANALRKQFEDRTLEDFTCYHFIAAIDNAPTVVVDKEIERQREELYQSCKKLFDTARMLGVERPQGEWGKWIIAEIQCPNCFEYFETDCYSTEELNKCPSCGAIMRKPNCVTCDHFGKCEGCEKGEEE